MTQTTYREQWQFNYQDKVQNGQLETGTFNMQKTVGTWWKNKLKRMNFIERVKYWQRYFIKYRFRRDRFTTAIVLIYFRSFLPFIFHLLFSNRNPEVFASERRNRIHLVQISSNMKTRTVQWVHIYLCIIEKYNNNQSITQFV